MEMRLAAAAAGLVVTLLLVAGLPPAGAQAEAVRCESGLMTARCEVRFAANSPTGTGFRNFQLGPFPAFAQTLATLTVTLRGSDGGWSYTIVQEEPTGGRQLSSSRHYPNATAPSADFASQTDTHLLLPGADRPLTLRFVNAARQVAEDLPVTGVTPASQGEFVVTYAATRLPQGETPSRPAATREDPHLSDAPDAEFPEYDLLAVWLDDARLDDGLFEAHLALEALGPVDFNRTALPLTSPAGPPAVSWYLAFRVLEQPYLVRWFAAENGTGSPTYGCELRRGAFESSSLLMNPACEYDEANGTLRATMPEAAVGSPAPGTTFDDVRAFVRGFEDPSQPQHDEAVGMRYPFALGGPAVWSRLNPRLDPPPEVVPAWYEAPLHEQNLPDTLQVAGAALATLTFLGGAVLLQRNRRQTRQLLARVDALVERHERDVREALLALGHLEMEFTRDFRRGRLNEAQYQVAVQRIASAASRLALRKELGLDDGVPDVATPSASREDEGASRRVPVGEARPAARAQEAHGALSRDGDP